MSRVLAALGPRVGSSCAARSRSPCVRRSGTTRARSELVERATERRAQQLADTALRDYNATAHGYLTFLAQVGEDFPDPPKVVRSDELALEVYWRAPNLEQAAHHRPPRHARAAHGHRLPPATTSASSRTTFPSIIRLGDGDEVRDVPHPLSAAGSTDYDFAIDDSLSIRLPGRTRRGVRAARSTRRMRHAAAAGRRALHRPRQRRRRAHGVHLHARRRISTRSSRTSRSCSRTRSCRGASGFRCTRRSRFGAAGRWLDFPARGIIRGRWEISRLRHQRAACRLRSSPAVPRSRARRRASSRSTSGTGAFSIRSPPTCAPRPTRTCARCRRRRARSCSSRRWLAREGASLSARTASRTSCA